MSMKAIYDTLDLSQDQAFHYSIISIIFSCILWEVFSNCLIHPSKWDIAMQLEIGKLTIYLYCAQCLILQDG